MSVTGVCQICESAAATVSCDRCGAAVCRSHHDADTGFCADCAAGAGMS